MITKVGNTVFFYIGSSFIHTNCIFFSGRQLSYQIPRQFENPMRSVSGHTLTLPPRRESISAASANERESVGNADYEASQDHADQSNDDIGQTNESEPALENESVEPGASNEASENERESVASVTKDLSALTAIKSVSELEQFCSGLSDSRLSEVAEQFLDFQAQ